MVDTALSPEEQKRELRLVYGWLPDAALDIYLTEYFRSSNPEAAWMLVRQDKRYEEWFPGNLIDKDGNTVLKESDYAKQVASYDEVFINVGLNPMLFRERYGDLIRGDVSPYELETNRINPMYERILEGSGGIQKWYSENYGLELTPQALLAGAIDPALGEKILTKQITLAEIGGAAIESGYGIDEGYADELMRGGLDKDAANAMFRSAENFLPVLNTLAKRHADPDDEFDLEEFVSADLFENPVQRRRMRRLVAQEQSTFTGTARTGMATSQDGGVVGLRQS